MCFGPLICDNNPNITSWLQAVSDNQVFITQSSDIDTDALIQGAGLAAGASFTYGSQSILAGHVYYWDATNSVFVDVVQINSVPETTVAHTLASYADTAGNLEDISTIIVGANNTLTGSAASAMTITTVSAATPADIAITGALATGTNVEGSDITITAGASNGSASGGDLVYTAGAGGATGNGGDAVFAAGAAGGTSGTGGNFTISGGAGTAAGAAGGNVTLSPGAPGAGGAAGTIALTGATAVTGALVASTALTATAGAITATNGNIVLGTAGNKVTRPAATTTAAGANSFGSVVLVGGTATVSTTSVTASSLIKLWRQSIGATGAAATGNLVVGTIVAGTSFVINAIDPSDATALIAADVSVAGWEIVN